MNSAVHPTIITHTSPPTPSSKVQANKIVKPRSFILVCSHFSGHYLKGWHASFHHIIDYSFYFLLLHALFSSATGSSFAALLPARPTLLFPFFTTSFTTRLSFESKLMLGFTSGLKRKADDRHHDLGRPYYQKNKGNESAPALEEFLSLDTELWAEYQKKNTAEKERLKEKWDGIWGKRNEDTEWDICFQMLQTMNKTLEVIANDRILIDQRIRQVEDHIVDEAVVDDRLRRLEIFKEGQHDYNDRICRVLKRLEAHPVMPFQQGNGQNESSASDIGVSLHSQPPSIRLDGDDIFPRPFDINSAASEELICMEGWKPPQPNCLRTATKVLIG